MNLLAPIFAWFATAFTGLATWGAAAVAGLATLQQFMGAAARLLRVAAFIAAIIAAVNLLLPPGATSISGLWATYSADLGDVAGFVALLFPVELLFILADLYLFGLLVLFTFSVVRRIFQAAT